VLCVFAALPLVAVAEAPNTVLLERLT